MSTSAQAVMRFSDTNERKKAGYVMCYLREPVHKRLHQSTEMAIKEKG